MKYLLFLIILTSYLSISYGQEEGSKGTEKIPIIEKATGPEKNEVGNTNQNKSRISVSSAARRRSLQNRRINTDEGRERAEGNNANVGQEVAEQAKNLGGSPPTNRPNINVPASRPNAPLVRPGRAPGSPPGTRNVPKSPPRPNLR